MSVRQTCSRSASVGGWSVGTESVMRPPCLHRRGARDRSSTGPADGRPGVAAGGQGRARTRSLGGDVRAAPRRPVAGRDRPATPRRARGGGGGRARGRRCRAAAGVARSAGAAVAVAAVRRRLLPGGRGAAGGRPGGVAAVPGPRGARARWRTSRSSGRAGSGCPAATWLEGRVLLGATGRPRLLVAAGRRVRVVPLERRAAAAGAPAPTTPRGGGGAERSTHNSTAEELRRTER